jgi:hypothetical protein
VCALGLAGGHITPSARRPEGLAIRAELPRPARNVPRMRLGGQSGFIQCTLRTAPRCVPAALPLERASVAALCVEDIEAV